MVTTRIKLSRLHLIHLYCIVRKMQCQVECPPLKLNQLSHVISQMKDRDSLKVYRPQSLMYRKYIESKI